LVGLSRLMIRRTSNLRYYSDLIFMLTVIIGKVVNATT